MFSFTGERPGSLMIIPTSWIVEKPKNKVDKTSWCYWPNKRLTDELQLLKKLIKNFYYPHLVLVRVTRVHKGKLQKFES